MRILIADENRMVREGLRSLLSREDDIDVVGEADDGVGAVQMARDLKPDIVIVDVAMPNLNGIEAARQIASENGHTTKIVALTMHTERPLVTQMLRVGAAGYLVKDCAFEELLTALRCVADDHAYLSASITRIVIDDYVQQAGVHHRSAFDLLTPREREVLQQVAEGNSTRLIASRLNLSTKTIEFHRHRMMKKLDLHSVAELTKYAVREGITSLDG